MNFINSVETQPLANIKKITELKNIPVDDNWFDYKALNKALECGRRDVAMHLLSKNFRVNNKVSLNTLETTPLHYAVKLGDAELVEQLLGKGAFLTVYNFEGNTPLHLAFILKYDVIVDLILSHMEKTLSFVECKNNQNLTHLHIASTRENLNVIEGLIKAGARITDAVVNESFSWAGYTALHFAVESQSLEAVKVLTGASNYKECNMKDSNDHTPLQILCQSLDKLLIMAYHLERESPEIDHEKLSYFDIACLRNDKKLVKKFIENGAQINNAVSPSAPIYPSSTPLHFAVETKCKENVDQLLHQGANVSCLNSYKMTPLHLALYADDPKMNDTIVDHLYTALQNKEENLVDDNNLSFLHIAVTRNDIEMVKNYLDKGVNVNSKVLHNLYGFSNFTPLHFAVFYQHMEMTKFLIKRGADVNINDEGPRGTPLHIACEFGNAGLIDLLLEYHANVDVFIVDKLSTPLHLLAEYYNDQRESSCLEYLLIYVDQLVKLGCNINHQDSDGNVALYNIYWEVHDSASFVRLFLELGANVNLQNKEAILPFDVKYFYEERCNSDEYSLFYNHIQNLKALGMEVHPKNEECCQMILDKGRTANTEGTNIFSDEELARNEKQRLDEITKMKNTMLTDHLRLYDFMLLDPRRAALYANNEVLRSIFDDKNFKVQYPTFYYLIRLNQQKGEKFCRS